MKSSILLLLCLLCTYVSSAQDGPFDLKDNIEWTCTYSKTSTDNEYVLEFTAELEELWSILASGTTNWEEYFSYSFDNSINAELIGNLELVTPVNYWLPVGDKEVGGVYGKCVWRQKVRVKNPDVYSIVLGEWEYKAMIGKRITGTNTVAFEFSFNKDIEKATTWSYSYKPTKVKNEYLLQFQADIQPGWSVYVDNTENFGTPNFTFVGADNIKFLGDVKLTTGMKSADNMPKDMGFGYVYGSGTWEQKVRVENPEELVFILGSLSYSLGKDEKVLLRNECFEIPLDNSGKAEVMGFVGGGKDERQCGNNTIVATEKR